MRRRTWLPFVVMFALAVFIAPCRAQSAGAEAAAGGKNGPAAGAAHPSAEDVLRQMANYVGGLPALSCRIESEVHVNFQTIDNRKVTKITVRLERPNRFALIVDEGVAAITTVSNGKQLVEYIPAMNRFVVREAPANLADIDGPGQFAAMNTAGLAGFTIPADGDDLYKQLMEGVTESQYIGLEKVGDVECHRCRFSQEDFDWDIWIEKGDRPVIHRIVPDLSKRFARVTDQLKGATIEFLVTFSDWNTAPKFTDADFAFTPPADAEKVDSLFGGEEEEEGPHPLLGQPAPPFKTVDLQDKEIDLGSELGKKVIILDFWATWCGPCVDAMPIINEVANKFKDRGVVLHAVNLGDDKETISEFLKSKQLEVPVAMDPDGTIGDLYKADAIPQTVLIGKDGKVQVVHVGFGEGLGELLSKQLDDLLAGKDLASEELAKAEQSGENAAEAAKAEEAATSPE